MKSFLSGSIFIIVFALTAACGKKTIPVGTPIAAEEQQHRFKRVIPKDSAAIYKTAVNAYGRYLSGLLVIKSSGEKDYRLILTTEMGVKLFDFEFLGEEFKVHFCVDQMNKKPVINLLKKDFDLMLARQINSGLIPATKSDTISKDQDVLFVLQENVVNYFTFDKRTNLIQTIKSITDKGKEKLFINFGRNGDVIPQTITLDHKNLDLNMKLELIKR